MGGQPRLLVIGSTALSESVSRELPNYEVVTAEHAIEGVWKNRESRFDGVLVSLALGERGIRVVQSLRRIAPEACIIVSCDSTLEPLGRRAVESGADDYVLEPFSGSELEEIFAHRPAPASGARPPNHKPSTRELCRLGDILQSVDDGAEPTLQRMAELLRSAFDAAGAAIEIEGMRAVIGDVTDAAQAPIRRGNSDVGRIYVGKSSGAAGERLDAHLTEYARLIEATVGLAKERDHWRSLAWTDDLSRLPNRRFFERRLDELLPDAASRRQRLTVLLFDIDGFKHYNDRFGHSAGDELIREVAELLGRCTRSDDLVARYGGDEFAVIFRESESPRVAGSDHPREPLALSQRFQSAIATHCFKCLGERAPGPVTISGGLACFPWNGTTREQLLEAADKALLEAKRTGKNRIQLADGGTGIAPC